MNVNRYNQKNKNQIKPQGWQEADEVLKLSPRDQFNNVIEDLQDHLLAPAPMAFKNVWYSDESEFLGHMHDELSMNSEKGIPFSKIHKYYTTNGYMSTKVEFQVPHAAFYDDESRNI